MVSDQGFGRPWRWVPAARVGSRPPPEAPGLPAPVPGRHRRRLGSASRTSAGRPAFPRAGLGAGAPRAAGRSAGLASSLFRAGRCPQAGRFGRSLREPPGRALGARAAERTVRAGRRGRAARGGGRARRGAERTAPRCLAWLAMVSLLPVDAALWWLVGGEPGWSGSAPGAAHRAGPVAPRSWPLEAGVLQKAG